MSGIPTPPHQKPDETGAATPDPQADREAFIAARKRRNVAIALGLVGFAVLIFAITALRLAQNISTGAAG
ncbi:MAG: protoheme IX farnesyltransferase [Maricaulis sp.]|jgi:hypothetical protein|nr:protoheme IX farnesyltransferase [Maricaulis sp.]